MHRDVDINPDVSGIWNCLNVIFYVFEVLCLISCSNHATQCLCVSGDVMVLKP